MTDPDDKETERPVPTKERPRTFDDFIKLVRKIDVPQDFMSDRVNSPPQERPGLFDDFDESQQE